MESTKNGYSYMSEKREDFFGYRGTGDFDCSNPTDTLLRLQSKKKAHTFLQAYKL